MTPRPQSLTLAAEAVLASLCVRTELTIAPGLTHRPANAEAELQELEAANLIFTGGSNVVWCLFHFQQTTIKADELGLWRAMLDSCPDGPPKQQCLQALLLALPDSEEAEAAWMAHLHREYKRMTRWLMVHFQATQGGEGVV